MRETRDTIGGGRATLATLASANAFILAMDVADNMVKLSQDGGPFQPVVVGSGGQLQWENDGAGTVNLIVDTELVAIGADNSPDFGAKLYLFDDSETTAMVFDKNPAIIGFDAWITFGNAAYVEAKFKTLGWLEVNELNSTWKVVTDVGLGLITFLEIDQGAGPRTVSFFAGPGANEEPRTGQIADNTGGVSANQLVDTTNGGGDADAVKTNNNFATLATRVNQLERKQFELGLLT